MPPVTEITGKNSNDMLEKLQIKNYALIEDMEIDFVKGFNILTGETGAGKSILLGALGLILGNRADLSALRNTDSKCIIEAEFFLEGISYKALFESLDLDFDAHTIIRREIQPSGKSRSFVNDSPVTLSVLNQIRPLLIDIHSQHQTLDLAKSEFQYRLLDLVGGHLDLLGQYSKDYERYLGLKQEIKGLKAKESELKAQYDYNLFLLKELKALDLENLDEEDLEASNLSLSNAEEIKELSSKSLHLIEDGEIGVENRVAELLNSFSRIAQLNPKTLTLHERLYSIQLELADIFDEFRAQLDQIEINPLELEKVNLILSQLHSLKQKHQVLSLKELIEKRDDLAKAVDQIDNFDQELEELNHNLEKLRESLEVQSKKISLSRKEAAVKIKQTLEDKFSFLGMPNAQIQFEILSDADFNSFGKDHLSLLFSANKGSRMEELKKVASGGELSRIMLAIKELIASFKVLPTLVFDEIDTGVSGDIAFKMGDMMKTMSEHIQVICISHLPQVAALGKRHFKVFKDDIQGQTQTFIKNLGKEERVEELAEMLGGKNYGNTAIDHAKDLLMD